MRLRSCSNQFRIHSFLRLLRAFGVAALQLFPLIAVAQEDAASRCDWAECRTEKPARGDSSEWTASLPSCEKSDEAFCGDKCHGEFDSDYHRCISKCMKSRCLRPGEGRDSHNAASGTGAEEPCLILESAACEENCSGDKSSQRARCRRDCLQRACPEANQRELAGEAADPGSIQCDSCRQRNQFDCQRTCLGGSYSRSGMAVSGLAGLACEKACLMSACGKSCKMRIP